MPGRGFTGTISCPMTGPRLRWQLEARSPRGAHCCGCLSICGGLSWVKPPAAVFVEGVQSDCLCGELECPQS